MPISLYIKICCETRETRGLRGRCARACAFRFWPGCARWCTVRALARVRGARVGAVRVGARCVGFAMRTPSQRCQRGWQGCRHVNRHGVSALRVVGARCALVRVGAVRVACRCASFLRVVAPLWLTVRRCGRYGAVVVSVSLQWPDTHTPPSPRALAWLRARWACPTATVPVRCT